MRIVILTVDHIYANLVVKALLQTFKKDIKFVIISGVILNKSTFLSSLKKYLEISGNYYFFAQVFKLVIYKFLTKVTRNEDSRFYIFKNVLKKQQIPYTQSADVNKKEFIRKMETFKPDLIVSVFFNQILSANVIKIPKKGVINIHPAYLPHYKGVSPVFWALRNKELTSGVSIHFVNEGIDTGGIISRKKIKISPRDGEDSLYLKCAMVGADLLIRAINTTKRGKVKTINNSTGRYYSLPTKEAVSKFKQNGRSFFKLKEYIFNK